MKRPTAEFLLALALWLPGVFAYVGSLALPWFILDQGANLQFDFLGHRFDPVDEAREPRIVELLVDLLDRGYGAQILLSQDVCHDMQLKANGGFGYAYLQQHFLPALRTAAVGEGELERIMVENPRRMLSLP